MDLIEVAVGLNAPVVDDKVVVKCLHHELKLHEFLELGQVDSDVFCLDVDIVSVLVGQLLLAGVGGDGDQSILVEHRYQQSGSISDERGVRDVDKLDWFIG